LKAEWKSLSGHARPHVFRLDRRIKVKIKYFDLVGDDEMMEFYKRKIWCDGVGSLVAFQFMYGVLFNSMILATLCVLIGCIDLGSAYAVGEICQSTIGALDGVCLNLYQWGITIPCGDSFNSMCSQWSSRTAAVTLWGSVLIIAGHYYLIGSTGSAAATFRSIPNSLYLLPSREIYQNGLRLGAIQGPAELANDQFNADEAVGNNTDTDFNNNENIDVPGDEDKEGDSFDNVDDGNDECEEEEPTMSTPDYTSQSGYSMSENPYQVDASIFETDPDK
jgi:hypothetical protein